MAVYEQDFSTLVRSIQEDEWVIYLKIFKCNLFNDVNTLSGSELLYCICERVSSYNVTYVVYESDVVFRTYLLT